MTPSIVRYLAALDQADRDESDVAEARTIPHQGQDRPPAPAELQALPESDEGEGAGRARPAESLLTDPDARSMATSGRRTGIVGYNVQAAVDAEHHLIVAHEVINVGHDKSRAGADGPESARRGGVREELQLWRIAATSTAGRCWRAGNRHFAVCSRKPCGPTSAACLTPP